MAIFSSPQPSRRTYSLGLHSLTGYASYAAMQQNDNQTLSLAEVLAEAIHTRTMVRITYNGAGTELEPYQIIMRNDAFHLAAFNPAKNRRSDEEVRLGHFKIAGIKHVELLASFQPLPELMQSQPRAEDRLLLAVD